MPASGALEAASVHTGIRNEGIAVYIFPVRKGRRAANWVSVSHQARAGAVA